MRTPSSHAPSPSRARLHHRQLGLRAGRWVENRNQEKRRLRWALVLTAVIAVLEVVGGYLTNSLALMSDAGHMLTDISALGLCLLALVFSSKPANIRKTYGYLRLEILSALANGVLLLAITVVIAIEAFHRFNAPTPIQLGPMAIVSALGLVANLGTMALLRRGQSLNIRGAFLHVLGDALASLGVLIGAGVMALTGW